MEDENVYKGWGFPVFFSKDEKRVETAFDYDDIRQSFEILFSTRPGERIIAPEYGIDLRRYAFEPVSNETIRNIKFLIFEAVGNFEPRVTLDEVEIIHSEGVIGSTLNIKLFYTVIELDVQDEFEIEAALD